MFFIGACSDLLEFARICSDLFGFPRRSTYLCIVTAARNTTVCFSGHRYYSGTEADELRLTEAVEAAIDDGYRTFISGMAPGFDLAAAQAVVHFRDLQPDVRLIAAIPFARQASKYTAADLARYEALLAAADEVTVLAEGYSHGCYYRRDEWMVARSGRIVCWYDGGRTPKSSSGTRYTVRRALKEGLEIVNLFRSESTLF